MASIRRRVDRAVHGLGSDRPGRTAVGIDHCELRRGVVVKQGLVLGPGQRVARFVRAALPLAGDGLLDLRTRRHGRTRRRGAQVGRHLLHQQRGPVPQPLHGAAEDGVELHALHATHLAVGDAAYPQFHARVGGVVERKARAIRRPRRRTGACTRGQRYRRFLAAREFQHAEPFQAGADAVAVRAIMSAVVARLHPHAGQLQIRLGHAGDGRELRLPDQDRALARGVQRRRWIERSAEHLQERLGRLQVSRLLRRQQRRHRQHQSYRQQHSSLPHHPPPSVKPESTTTKKGRLAPPLLHRMRLARCQSRCATPLRSSSSSPRVLSMAAWLKSSIGRSLTIVYSPFSVVTAKPNITPSGMP